MASALYIIAVMATFAVFASEAADYCRLESCKGPYHTICKYGFLRVDRYQCRNAKTTSLTRSEIMQILRLHNHYRLQVASGHEPRGAPGPQPAARNMNMLSWDVELANIAQTWANQCLDGHDTCRHSERFSVGQNVAWKSSSAGYIHKFTDMVTMWYEEVKDFNKHLVTSVTDFNKVGHYTQLLWAETTLVGCGGIRYERNGMYRTALVCNYGPRGNWVGEEMYKTR